MLAHDCHQSVIPTPYSAVFQHRNGCGNNTPQR